MWQTRLLLEQRLHDCSVFVTLTYRDEELPGGANLERGDLQGFMRRLRKEVDSPLRFYGVGEYGGEYGRPHYHVALFGYPRENLYIDYKGRLRGHAIDAAWQKGFADDVAELTPELAAYIAGYTVNKIVGEHRAIVGERTPEFALMSLKPGLGAGAVAQIGESFNSSVGAATLAREGDVPGAVRVDGKIRPLGRYLKGKLRDVSGVVPENVGVVLGMAAERLRCAVVEAGGPGAYDELLEQHGRRAEAKLQIMRARSRSRKGVQG